jgi:hypothetical protein
VQRGNDSSNKLHTHKNLNNTASNSPVVMGSPNAVAGMHATPTVNTSRNSISGVLTHTDMAVSSQHSSPDADLFRHKSPVSMSVGSTSISAIHSWFTQEGSVPAEHVDAHNLTVSTVSVPQRRHADVRTLEKECARVRGELAKAKSFVKELSEAGRTLEDQYVKLDEEHVRLKERHAQLLDQSACSQAQCLKLQQEADDIRIVHAQVQTELGRVKAEYTQSEQELVAVKKECVALMEENTRLKKKSSEMVMDDVDDDEFGRMVKEEFAGLSLREGCLMLRREREQVKERFRQVMYVCMYIYI